MRNGTESSKTATDRNRDKDHDDVYDIDDSGSADDDDVVVVVGGGGAGVVVDDDDDTSVAELPVGGVTSLLTVASLVIFLPYDTYI